MKLRVPGATLHYQVCGSGPTLLISQSGEGDADRSTDLLDQLRDRYTVVTYDRRGLSRSVPDNPRGGVTLAEHADDVHHLLAELADEPVLMLGCSLGAAIGLHLAIRHSGQVSTLIAHEPVAPSLLPTAERASHRDELTHIQQIHRRDGLARSLTIIADVLGIDTANPDTEPDLTPQPMNAQRIANFEFFVEHDFTAIIGDDLPTNELKNVPTHIVPTAGRTTPRTVFDYRCAEELADLLGTELVEFPGGHNGNTTHPRAYAARLHGILQHTA
jgi:pimeloyl-ACP methyl ester carboxylesterase